MRGRLGIGLVGDGAAQGGSGNWLTSGGGGRAGEFGSGLLAMGVGRAGGWGLVMSGGRDVPGAAT